ncbi:retrovirus-related pol polyprotein from transposon TNT 1-94 [Tanacetum coccineum]
MDIASKMERTHERIAYSESPQTYSSQRHHQGSQRLLEDILVSWDGYQLICRWNTLKVLKRVRVNSFGNAGNPNMVEDVFQTDNTNNTGTNNVAYNVVNEDLPQLLYSRGGSNVTNVPPFDVDDFTSYKYSHDGTSDTRDTKIASPRLKFNVFKALEGKKVKETFTMLKILLNELKNKDVKISQAEVNATFVKILSNKWLSMNQTQRANNSIKNDTLATLYGKYNYEEELIDQIYESETKRFTIKSSTSKALISNTHFQDSDSDAEIDTRSSSEFLVDLNAEFYDRALFANHKRFYKRSRRVVSARKQMDISNETCFACGKQGHFQKYCPTTKHIPHRCLSFI